MTTCIFTSNSSIKHDTGPGHPECSERIPSIINGIKKIQTPKLIWKNVGSFDEKYIIDDYIKEGIKEEGNRE